MLKPESITKQWRTKIGKTNVSVSIENGKDVASISVSTEHPFIGNHFYTNDSIGDVAAMFEAVAAWLREVQESTQI